MHALSQDANDSCGDETMSSTQSTEYALMGIFSTRLNTVTDESFGVVVSEIQGMDSVMRVSRLKKRIVLVEKESGTILRNCASVRALEVEDEQNSRRIFSTDVPTSFVQNINSKAIPSHGFCIEGAKEKYIVKISGPNRIISCKCTVKEDGRLNVSCIDKNLDMRLMLTGKRKINTLTENELSNIQGLLSSAIVDLNVKGRLRWPLGTTFDDGYKILEGLRLETDGFSERDKTGEIAKGVTLVLKEMNTKLQEQNIERGCVLEMLRGVLGTIWDFMCCDGSLM
ncbi:Uncharacterized protein Rs2_31656 [Raphanus sativus]|nr:Uncharacterized protein Rs2_31656 [Raphanus sativus]